MSAKIIMFDGADGVGKSTQLAAVKAAAEAKGLKVHTTRINGGTPFGEQLRTAMLGPESRSPLADLHVALAMYADLANQLDSDGFREEYDLILIDRSPLSILAFQVAGSGLDADSGTVGYRLGMHAFQPDLVCVYEAPYETLRERLPTLSEIGKGDYFEDKDASYHERVANAYHEALQLDPAIAAIDAVGAIDEVTDRTRTTIQDRLGIKL